MFNQITDQLRLAEARTVKGFPLISNTISALENISQEVFRGETYLGSVGFSDIESASSIVQETIRMKVRAGDTIFRVKLIPQPYSFAGTLHTLDEYVRIYEMTIELEVSNPSLFIRFYREGRDPANWAIGNFKALFKQHAGQLTHDKMSSLNIPFDRWNSMLSTNVGIKINRVRNYTLRDDPKRAELLKIQQDTEITKASLRTKAEIQSLEDHLARERDKIQKEHERQELAKHKAFERWELMKKKSFDREEETNQNMHKLHINLRNTAAEELTAILRERIRDTFEAGGQIDEVATDSMRLLNAFHESLQRGSIVDSIPLQENKKENSEERHEL